MGPYYGKYKKYRPETNSISSGQVLHCPYNYEKTKLIVKEMTELLSLDLNRKKASNRSNSIKY